MTDPRKDDMLYRIEILHECGVDPFSREIFVSGESESTEAEGPEPGVEFLMASRFIKNLRHLTTLDNTKPILIHLKTCGGYWEEGMAMYDAIHACPCYVCALSYTHARSMSSIIIQAADQRVLMPNSYFMYHLGWLSIAGSHQEVVSFVDWEKRTKETMKIIYAEKMHEKGIFKGKSLRGIKEFLQEQMNKKAEVYLTAKQAVELGLADEIFKGDWEGLVKE